MLPVNACKCNEMTGLASTEGDHSLLLHLVDELFSRGGEFVCDNIAHVHQILQPLVQDLVHADIVCECK